MKVETDYRRANRERQKRYREEMKTRGYTMTSIYMNAETRLKLDSLCKSEGKTKAQIIERMISQYETPVSKDTVPPAREYNRKEICKIILDLRDGQKPRPSFDAIADKLFDMGYRPKLGKTERFSHSAVSGYYRSEKEKMRKERRRKKR